MVVANNKIQNMKKQASLLFFLTLLSLGSGYAQEKRKLTLKEAIEMAVQNSTSAELATTKVKSAELALANTKNNQYPGAKISGQYMRLSSANVKSNLQSNSSSEPATPLKVDQLLLGQANVTMPIFSGFKLKNSIKTSESLYQAETFAKKHSNEAIGLEVVELFASLYKAQQMTLLIADNLKTAEQRVKDFTAMEENGLIARNDLLKAQLQVSNIKLALDNAKKNAAVANYQLITLLKLPESTVVDIDIEAIKKDMAAHPYQKSEGERNDLKALSLKKAAADSEIKVAKSNYYPSLALSGGYIALDLNNVLTVTNAMNFGLGFSYDLSSIFKNGKQVQFAQSKAKETSLALEQLNEQVKEEVFQASENYNLSLKQSAVYDEAVAQASENYRIVKDKYDNSLSTTNDLLEADFEQLQAQINQALSKADVAQKYYELQFASGQLLNSLQLTQN